MARFAGTVVLTGLVIAGVFGAGDAALAAASQDPAQERERIRQQVLERVDQYLEQQMGRLRDEIERILDEELSRRAPQRTDRPVQQQDPQEQPPARQPGYLGVYPADVDGAVVIEEVLEGSPAEEAGLQAGDVILAVNGREIGAVDDLRGHLRRAGAGATVSLRIDRDGEESDVEVTLAHYPDQNQPAPSPQVEPEPEPEPEPQATPAPQDESDLRRRIRDWIERRREGRPDEPEQGHTEPAPEAEGDVWAQLDAMVSDPQVQELLNQLEEPLREMGFDLGQWVERNESDQWVFGESARDYIENVLSQFDTPEEGLEALRQRFEAMRGRLEEMLGQFGIDPEQIPDVPSPPQPQPEPEPTPEPQPSERRGGYLGIAVVDLGSEVRAAHDLEDGVGVYITRVAPDSPAANAGLRVEDIVTQLDGEPVRGERDLVRRLARRNAGERIRLTVLRDDGEETIEVRLGER